MEMIGKIRRMYLRDKLSLHEITKRTGLSRNTVRRWLRSPKEAVPPTYRRREGQCKLTAFHELLELRFPWFFVFQEAGFMLPVSLSVE